MSDLLTKHVNWVAVALVALVTALLGYQAVAMQAGAHAPSVITSVDLERLFNGLDERAKADIDLQNMADQLEAQGVEKRAAIDELNDTLDLYPVGSDNYTATMERLQLAALDYEAFMEFGRRKIDVEKALTLKRIYLSIKECSRKMAESDGYDVVFVDDSIADLLGGSEQEIRRSISARRMLYTSPTIDVTDELIQVMNDAFATGGCAP